MFEKEAEDSFNCKKVLYKWKTDKHSYIDGFQDGAEFGYNKAKEDAKKIIEDLVDFLAFLEGEQVAGILAVKRAKQFLKR